MRVVVLYDAFGTVDMPASHRDALRAAGILVEPFRPIRLSTLHLAQNRSHVRGIVIDSRVGWTGGFGIDDKWLGDGRTDGAWRETNVRFEGPAVRQLQAAFAAAWVEATGVMLTGHATLAPQEQGVAAAAACCTRRPPSEARAAERFFALSIAGARRDAVHHQRVLRARTATSSTCWPPRPDAGSTSGSSRRARGPTWRSSARRGAPGTRRCSRPGFACSNGSRPRSTPRPSSSTGSGPPSAR